MIKEFIKDKNIERYEFAPDDSKLTCFHSDGNATVFYIGQKHRMATRTELIDQGHIVLNGYEGKNWLYVVKYINGGRPPDFIL